MRHRLVRLVGALRSILQEYLTNFETFWIMLANLDLTMMFEYHIYKVFPLTLP